MQAEKDNIIDRRTKSEEKPVEKDIKEKKSPDWLMRIKSVKHIEIIIAIIVIVVMIVAYTYSIGKKDKTENVSGSEVTLTEELQNILTEIKGVGDVKLLIVYNGGKRLEIASKVDKHSNIVNDEGRITETITEVISPIITAGDKPLVIGETRAEIDGVIVVAEGGSDSTVKLHIMQAICTLLKIDYGSIKVFEMK